MRMAALQLVADSVRHVVEIEYASFTGHVRVKHDLKEKITELVAQITHVAPGNGVRHFVSLLDGVRSDAAEILLAVPGATVVGIPERDHDVQESIDGSHRLNLSNAESENCILAIPVTDTTAFRHPWQCEAAHTLAQATFPAAVLKLSCISTREQLHCSGGAVQKTRELDPTMGSIRGTA